MVKRYLGGVLSPTTPTVTALTASGMYTVTNAAQYTASGTWPQPADIYFEYVTMLLPGTGTNGAQNNTFLDSSTNNFTITRNGNTTQGTFTPYGANWSLYQPAVTSDYLNFSTSPGALFEFTGDYTIEMWVFPVILNNDSSLWVTSNSGVTAYHALNIDTTNYNIYLNSAGPTSSFAHGLTVNQWNHVALVRSGSTVTAYTNGVSRGTITNSSTNGYSSPGIARTGGGAPGSYSRYLSNLRIVKGTAVYTTAFTPPTAPLTAISGTSLLTCQANRFIDSSANALTATVTGSPSVQRFSPFNPTAAYSAATIGGSGYFDGSGDYLNVAAQTALGMGAGDFTYEAWIYVNEVVPTNAVRGLFDSRVSGATGCGIYTSADSGTTSRLVYATNSAIVASSSITITPYTWTHIAVTRSSGTVRGFINGTLQFTITDSRTFSSSSGTYIAADVNLSCFNGYINDARILKGTAQYTSDFTPPTAPLTAITNTSLLLSYTNGGIIDNAMMNDLETVGNAQISTSVSKFGGGSLAFDGSGDYLLAPASPNFAFGRDFTVEAWVYLTANPATDVGAYLTDFRVSSSNNFAFGFIGAGGATRMYGFVGSGAVAVTGSAVVSLNQWNHVAYVRSGSTVTLYLNGVSCGTFTTSFSQGATSVTIASRFNGATEYITGNIDDLRLTQGYARYTANFTPPVAPFQLQ